MLWAERNPVKPSGGWCLTLFAPISVVALFSCLNLTFMAYGFRNHTGLH